VLNWSGFSKTFRTRSKEEQRRQREKRSVARRQLLLERLDERAVLSTMAGVNPGETVDTSFVAEQLASALVGFADPGVTISNATFTGDAVQKGSFTFTDPTVVGFDKGIILASGNAADVVGPNTADWTSSTFPAP